MTRARPAVALTVAGSDSSGGAGIQADLKTFGAFGVWGTCAVTAVTAQNTAGVLEVHVLPASMVRAQFDAVAADIRPAAVKTGMLATAAIVESVAAAVAHHGLSQLVVDPVLAASQGGRLLAPDGLGVMKDRLFPLCAVLTPNIPEAEALLMEGPIAVDDMPDAAAALAAMGPRAVLLKGGHLAGDLSRDLLWCDGVTSWLEAPRIDSRNTHGTGCTLAAAITARLAAGTPIPQACEAAKVFVTRAIAAGLALGEGPGSVDPSRALGDPS